MKKSHAPLLQQVAHLVIEMEPCHIDSMVTRLPGYSREQIQRAAENAAYRELIRCISRQGRASQWYSAATADRLDPPKTIPDAIAHEQEAAHLDVVHSALMRRPSLETLWLSAIAETTPEHIVAPRATP